VPKKAHGRKKSMADLVYDFKKMEDEQEELSDSGDRETMCVQATHSLKVAEKIAVPSKGGRISFGPDVIPEEQESPKQSFKETTESAK
jgi:hypothetical protein